MRALNRLHVQIHFAVVFADRGVATVGERAARPVAEAGDIVHVAAKSVLLG